MFNKELSPIRKGEGELPNIASVPLSEQPADLKQLELVDRSIQVDSQLMALF